MTAKNEMPGVTGFCPGIIRNPPICTDKGCSGTEKYHHTAALIERIEGMKKPLVFDDNMENPNNQRHYNAALQDVIDILKGVE